MAASVQSISEQEKTSQNRFIWSVANESACPKDYYSPGERFIDAFLERSWWTKESEIFKLDAYGIHFNLLLYMKVNNMEGSSEYLPTGYSEIYIHVSQVRHPAYGSLIITYNENSFHYNFSNMSPGNYLALTFDSKKFEGFCSQFIVEWVERKQWAAEVDPLSKHLNELQESKEFSDMVIITGDGTSFPVHKAILSAWSSVFSAMLKADMHESRKKCTEIVDFSSNAVRNLIKYMYTGRLPKLDYDSASELLIAADKYNIMELKTICVDQLLLLLDCTNGLDLLQLMYTYHKTYTRETVLKFISQHGKQFLSQGAFHRLRGHPELLEELLCFQFIHSTSCQIG